jgi:DNA-binding transcriptional LysR family regulator
LTAPDVRRPDACPRSGRTPDGVYLEATDGHLSGPDELAGHAWIGWEETAAGIHAVDWLRRAAPASAFVYRTSSLVNQFAAARAGIGLALLPCYLGDGDPEIVRALTTPWPS